MDLAKILEQRPKVTVTFFGDRLEFRGHVPKPEFHTYHCPTSAHGSQGHVLFLGIFNSSGRWYTGENEGKIWHRKYFHISNL